MIRKFPRRPAIIRVTLKPLALESLESIEGGCHKPTRRRCEPASMAETQCERCYPTDPRTWSAHPGCVLN